MATMENYWNKAILILLFLTWIIIATSSSSSFISLSSDELPATGIPFVTIDRGAYSGINDALTQVLRTENEFTTFWMQHRSIDGGESDNTNTPTNTVTIPNDVDFAKEMVVVVCMGEQTSGGYAIEITSINPYYDEDLNDNDDSNNNALILAVNFVTSAPPSSSSLSSSSSSLGTKSMLTMALTQPYHIIRLDIPVLQNNDNNMKFVFVGSEIETSINTPQIPVSTTTKFILVVGEDEDKEAIRTEIETLLTSSVINVEVLSSLPFLFVDIDLSSIEKNKAKELLRKVTGVKSIEEDS